MVETSEQLRKRLELQDYGHELAGLHTGRRVRFGVGEGSTGSVREKERKERAYRDALARLLAEDPAYRALYEDLGNRLGEAEAGADANIEAIQTALRLTREANADLHDNAPKIDGMAVFRYSDGRVVDENRNEIDEAVAEGIIWPDDAPTAEEYFAGLEREAELAEALSAWETYRHDTLGDIRHRYDDRDNPNSADAMREDLETIQQDAPDIPSVIAMLADESHTVSAAPQNLLTLEH
ncbi:MAG: hypothetical protein AAGG69_06730 [Pseudomonadota bacterium]